MFRAPCGLRQPAEVGLPRRLIRGQNPLVWEGGVLIMEDATVQCGGAHLSQVLFPIATFPGRHRAAMLGISLPSSIVRLTQPPNEVHVMYQNTN